MALCTRNQLREPYSDFIVREAKRWIAQIPKEARRDFRDLIRARAALEGCTSSELLRAVLEHLDKVPAPRKRRGVCTLIST